MELILRFLGFLLKIFCHYLVLPIIILINKYNIKDAKIPPIQDKLLYIPAVDLATKIRNKEVTSEEVVLAYIERIKQVNKLLNAVVSERFHEAILDARKADKLVRTMNPLHLFKDYPLLGVPFTVKESCSLKGMSYSVGSLIRKGKIATSDGDVIANLRAAGCIPLLASNTPEYCVSWESFNFITGRTLNPHNLRRTPGGSSGGEAALVGAGASIFGIGSDLAGSIRIPAMFVGAFGHKSTGGLMSLKGHFPNCQDEEFQNYLSLGPICRYSKDLPTIVRIMAGENAKKLRFDEPLYTKDIKIYYMEDLGFSYMNVPVQPEIKLSMLKALQHFKSNGLLVEEAPFKKLHKTLEMGLALFFDMKHPPELLTHPDNPEIPDDNVFLEFIKSLIGQSKYTQAALVFYLVAEVNAFLPRHKIPIYVEKSKIIRQQFLDLLGDDGVFFFPCYPTSALHHNDAIGKISGVNYSMLINWLGFPATQVPLGKDENNLPIGIQIVAAPYQDRLSMLIAGELEAAFGGWIKPF